MVMEENNLNKDDLLGRLIQKSSPDNPSDDFVDRIMEKVQAMPEFSDSKKTIYSYLRSILPFIFLTTVVFLFLFTSDLPFFNYFPGKEYFTQTFVPYFVSFLESFKVLISSKYISFFLTLVFAAGVLIFIEMIFSRRTKDFFLSKGL